MTLIGPVERLKTVFLPAGRPENYVKGPVDFRLQGRDNSALFNRCIFPLCPSCPRTKKKRSSLSFLSTSFHNVRTLSNVHKWIKMWIKCRYFILWIIC